MTRQPITVGGFGRPPPPTTLTAHDAASARPLTWTRSERGFSLYTTQGGVHLSVYRRPNSGLRFKIDGALPPDLGVEDGQAFVLALLAGGLDAARDGGVRS